MMNLNQTDARQRVGFRKRDWLSGAIIGVTLASVGLGAVMDGGSSLPVPEPTPSETTALAFTDSSGDSGGMKLGPKGEAMIKEYEQLKLSGYELGDGKCTIGWGHTVPLSEKSGSACTSWTITEAEAEEIFQADVQRIAAGPINEYFDRTFNQCQFDALVTFSYNVGSAFKKYDWPTEAADSYFPGVMIQYVNPPKFKAGLLKRRKAEIALFESKDCPAPSGSAATPPANSNNSSGTGKGATPGVMITQYPSISSLFSGGISARK